MPQKEQDSFENGIKNHAKFHKSSMLSGGRKKKNELLAATREIIFGFNRKQDNKNKTGQLKLF